VLHKGIDFEYCTVYEAIGSNVAEASVIPNPLSCGELFPTGVETPWGDIVYNTGRRR
jgi:hypothetical protein